MLSTRHQSGSHTHQLCRDTLIRSTYQCAVAHAYNRADRRGFTLIELLVVISIILILAATTIASFNYSVSADRMRSAARQFQSFLAGARDKAIYANDVRGVRLLLDPNDNHAVSAMQYIGAPEQETGTLQIDQSNDATLHTMNESTVSTTRWQTLRNRGFLRVGSRIQIPKGIGSWYTVTGFFTPSIGSNPEIVLDRSLPTSSVGLSLTYLLELTSGVLGDAQPVPLPRGVVIDLDGSLLPNSWRPSPAWVGTTQQQYLPTMDILFSPRGFVVGDCATLGFIHLHFADASDVLKWHSLSGRSSASYTVPIFPVVPANNMNPVSPAPPVIVVTKDRILATLSTRNGAVSTHYVNEQILPVTNTTGTTATDPFSFAETGQVANK